MRVPIDPRIGERAAVVRAGAESDARLVERTERDGQGRVVRRWSEWYRPGAPRVLHGREQRLDPSGQVRLERHWDHGRPTGRWRTWYADGTLRSDFECTGGPVPMRFYHPDGSPSAEGPGVDGVREGSWTYWYPGGALRKRGEYLRGEEHGEWTLWAEDGSLEARGRYLDGVRVGEWELAPGEERAPQ